MTEETNKPAEETAKKPAEETATPATDIAKLSERISQLETERKGIAKERDEYRAKLKQMDDAESIKKGDLQKVLTEKEKEIEELKSVKEEMQVYKAKAETIEKERREELVSKLDPAHKKIAEALPLDLLTEYVKVNAKVKHDDGRGGLTFSTEGRDWDSLTTAELDEIKEKNEPLYNKLKKEKFKQKGN